MMTIKEIENAVLNLPQSDFDEFAEWFEDHMARLWDDQIENDAKTGRFDGLIDQAKAEHEAGRFRPL